MRAKLTLLFLAILMLMVSITANASNMGFKISISLQGSGKSNWVSLPYYSSYATAGDIWTDLTAAGITPVQVSRYQANIGQFINYTGRGTPFSLVPGEGVLIKVSNASPAPWIVVGSHNPSLTLTLIGAGGSNWVSIPYHTTASDAGGIWTQLQAAGMTPVQVSRYNAAIGQFVNYTGRGTPFTLVLGEAVLIKVSDTTPPGWLPSHY